MAKILIRQPSNLDMMLGAQFAKRGHEVGIITRDDQIPEGEWDLLVTNVGSTNQMVRLTLAFYQLVKGRGIPYVIYASGIPPDDRLETDLVASLHEFIEGAKRIITKVEFDIIDQIQDVLRRMGVN